MPQTVKFTYVPDVFRPNDCRVLQGDPTLPLAAGVWECHRIDDMDQARTHCLGHVVRAIQPSLESGWEPWLVAAHGAVQSMRALDRRNVGGIWESLARDGVEFAHETPMEVEHLLADGLRWVGATKWTAAEIDSVNSAMRTEFACPLLIHRNAPISQIIDSIINVNPDAASRVVPTHILAVLENEHSAMIDIWGEYDDREIAVSVVGRTEVLAGLGIHPQSESPR
ncbi:MAG: hypothetical protein ACFHWZ_15915 [Phycisphaerales bacterium]